MEIGATKAVQDRLKTTKIEESKGASLVFCWDTHLTKIKGRNVLFIVNASNRYTIAMTDIEPRNLNYYTMYIRSVIHGVMQEMGYSEEQIGQYFKMSGDTTVTKTHGRKSVGGINRILLEDTELGECSPSFAGAIVVYAANDGWREWRDSKGNMIEIYRDKLSEENDK